MVAWSKCIWVSLTPLEWVRQTEANNESKANVRPNEISFFFLQHKIRVAFSYRQTQFIVRNCEFPVQFVTIPSSNAPMQCVTCAFLCDVWLWQPFVIDARLHLQWNAVSFFFVIVQKRRISLLGGSVGGSKNAQSYVELQLKVNRTHFHFFPC